MPDPLAVVDPRGDLDLETPLLEHAAGAVARRARLLDPAPRARAGGARLRAHELAEDAARHLLQAAGAAAGRARHDGAAGLGPVAAAAAAHGGDLERHFAFHAARGVHELDLDRGEEIGAARAAGPTPAEQVVAEERREQVGEAPEVEVAGLEAAAAEAGMAVAVVELARLRLGEHLVRLHHLAETVVRVGRVGDVGMQLAREPAEGLLDLRLARAAGDAEQLVVVAFRSGHESQM